MATYEKRAVRDGVPVPIQCIRMMPRLRSELRFHYHDYTELLYGLSGTATVRVGGESYTLGKGDMVIIHNHELHDVLSPSDSPEYIVIKFLPSVLLTPEQTYSEYSYTLTLMQNTADRQNYFKACELEDTPINDLFLHAMQEWDERKVGYELSLRADTISIFLHILRKWYDSNISGSFPSVTRFQGELIQRAIDYIEGNYYELTEESTAAALGVSVSYLSRVFKRGMKRSFSSYVNSVKLREAQKLLISTDKSVTEIGEIIGFSTSAYFIATFRGAHGVTPGEYRRLLRGNNAAEEQKN